jgi:hypothetical protein
MTDELQSLAERIGQGIDKQGRYFVSAPAEMAQLGELRQALAFAREHGWILVCHLGGANYEFFQATHSPQQELF